MPIKAYVSRDSQGRPWPPDNDHEASACIDVIKRLWWAFASQSIPYAVAVNLHEPSADCVILSEHGIGVLELKHCFGSIWQTPDDTWYADEMPIRAGAANLGYKSPRFQVRAYAEQLRDKLIHPKPSSAWLPGNPTVWSKFKFQTGVCFTHPDAHIANLKKSVRQQPGNLPWEEFSVLMPTDVPTWAASLRFETSQGPEQGYEPHRLTPTLIVDIATELLGLVEWTEISELMPTMAPYAYVSLVEGGRRMQVFGLDREEVTLGRDCEKCSVMIPERYTRASRIHARIQWAVDGVYINDYPSRNGTFVKGQRVNEPRRLVDGDQITLGGAEPSGKVCLLVFSTRAHMPSRPITTEIQDQEGHSYEPASS